MIQNVSKLIIYSLIIPLLVASNPSSESSSIQSSSPSSQSSHASQSSSHSLASSSSIASLASSKQQDSSSSDDNLSPFPTIHAVSDEGLVYYTNISLGSPPQDLQLRIDVANSYVWVRSRESLPTCENNETSTVNSQCETGTGAFNVSDSSSYHDFNDWQRLMTLDYIWINGTVSEDSMSLLDISGGSELNHNNNITIDDFDLIVSNESRVVMGGLGLAGKTNDQLDNYDNINFLDMLKQNNVINSSSYSLYHKDNLTADLVLGGINQDYYTGDFVKFNQVPYLNSQTNQLEYNYPILPLTSLKVSSSDGRTAYISTSNDTEPVLIDTRSSYNYLPYSMVVALAVQLNAFYSDDIDVWLLKCSVGNLNATVGFQFGNVTIEVPISEMITPAKSSSGGDNGNLVFDDGDEACLLLVTPNYYFGYSVLGSPFFKSAYIAVDHESNQIAIAQAAKVPHKGSSSSSTTTLSNSSSTLDFAKSQISSGYIPFAVTNNLTESYTMKFDQTSIHSSVQPDLVTVSITNGEIFTGRVQSTNSSNDMSSTSSGGAIHLFNVYENTNNNCWCYIMSLLTVLGFGLIL